MPFVILVKVLPPQAQEQLSSPEYRQSESDADDA